MTKKTKLNLNDFAKEITLLEGGKESVSIAQVKEIMRLVFSKLASLSALEVLQLLARYER